MNAFKAIGRLVSDPICAIVVCAGGGFAVWYFGMQSPAGAPKAELVAKNETRQPAVSSDRSEKPATNRKAVATATGKTRKPAKERDLIATRKSQDTEQREVIAQRDADSDVDQGERADDGRLASTPPASTPAGSPEVAAADRAEPPSRAKGPAGPPPATPEGLLESKGLTKSGGFYVLPIEKEVEQRYRDVRPRHKLMQDAFNKFAGIADAEANFQAWDVERINVEAQIKELDIEIQRLAGSRVPVDAANRGQMIVTRTDRYEYLVEVNRNLEIARKGRVTTEAWQAAHDDAMTLREKFLESSKALASKCDEMKGEYKELEQDSAVKDALRVVSLRLGPSKDLRDKIQQVIRAERDVSFDPDAYKPKSKLKSKPNKK